MKVKIIDLANKIINDELEDGFKILKDGNVVLVYNRENKTFTSECGNIQYIKFDYFGLNKEVEIIEEDKEIEYEEIKECFAGVELEYNKSAPEYKINQLIRNQKKIINELKKGK